MAKLIVKSPYIKCGGSGSAVGYMKYIATRERVEIIHDDRSPTRKQEQLIAKLVKDFPDSKELYEYGDYMDKPTRASASAFITLALESNWEDIHGSEQYMKYIATRPRAERLGSHGLFGDEDNVDLEKTMAELDSYTGNVWTHILSLRREDAARLGYDNANTWRNLLRTHRNEIASAMNIPAGDFRWYAAFHDEGEHPHVHMMAWSVKPGQAYLNRDGIQRIKSGLTNDIFRMEMLHLYEQKSVSRDELVRQSKEALRELTRQIRTSLCTLPEAEKLMQTLAEELNTVNGKKSYGYLPKPMKLLVDEVVDQLEQLPVVKECYEKWLELQWQVDNYYKEKPKKRGRLSQQKEFRQIKNAVIQEAEHLRLGDFSFEDAELEKEDEPEDAFSSYRYGQLREIILEEGYSLEERDEAVKQLEQLAENNDPDAQYLMGRLWRDGPLLTPDWVNARYWLIKAANQNHGGAQYALGKLYLSDDTEVCDPQKGLQCLKAAAENGNDYAAYRLGKEYLTGKNTEKDIALAAKYFTQAAEAGNQFAQYMLGKLYLTGEGVQQNREQAFYWLSWSAEQGTTYAQFFLDHWEQVHSPSVMLSVTRLLYHMSRIFEDRTPQTPNAGQPRIDRKRLARLREKKIAAGHKPDDYPEQGNNGQTLQW